MVPDTFQFKLGQPPGMRPNVTAARDHWPVLVVLQQDRPVPRLRAVPSNPMPPSAVSLTCPAKSPQTPMMHRILNTAEPTMVPTPTSPLVMKTPERDLMSAWLLWLVQF